MLLLKAFQEPVDVEEKLIDELLARPERRGEYVKRAKGYEAPFVVEKRPTEMSLLRGMLADAEGGVDIGGGSYRRLSGVAHAVAYGLVQLIEATGSASQVGVSRGQVRQSSPVTAAHLSRSHLRSRKPGRG